MGVYLICETLVLNRVTPFYYQARFAQVPNADFDIALYHPRRPVVLSARTSLRERYQQADLEGLALRQVYRNAEIYLLTLSGESVGVQKKIKEGYVTGLTACIKADTIHYDKLLVHLKSISFEFAKEIKPLEGRPVSSI